MRGRVIAATMLGASLVALGLGGWSRLAVGEPAEFDEARMFIEYNATAGDVGVQVFLDGEPWKRLRVFNPAGKLILQITGRHALAQQGLTELFFESSEPPLTTLPLPVFFARFPKGEYEFVGVTIEGEVIEGTADFTHRIPQEPVVVLPVPGQMQNPNNTVVVWLPVPNPPGGEIAGYQATVTLQDEEVFPLPIFSVHVPADVLSVKVPATFLKEGASYEFEVLAIEAGGNQTIHAGTFTTAP